MLGNMPLHNSEPRVYECEQKLAPFSREQVCFPSLHSIPDLPKVSSQLNTRILHHTFRVLHE